MIIDKYRLDFKKIKENIKIKNKKDLINRFSNENTILIQGTFNKEICEKIINIILQNKSNKILKETANKNIITAHLKF